VVVSKQSAGWDLPSRQDNQNAGVEDCFYPAPHFTNCRRCPTTLADSHVQEVMFIHSEFYVIWK